MTIACRCYDVCACQSTRVVDIINGIRTIKYVMVYVYIVFVLVYSYMFVYVFSHGIHVYDQARYSCMCLCLPYAIIT